MRISKVTPSLKFGDEISLLFYYYLAPKKQKHMRGYDADRVTRAHLLWNLLLTRNKHRRDSIPRPVHMRKSMEVHKVPLKLG